MAQLVERRTRDPKTRGSNLVTSTRNICVSFSRQLPCHNMCPATHVRWRAIHARSQSLPVWMKPSLTPPMATSSQIIATAFRANHTSCYFDEKFGFDWASLPAYTLRADGGQFGQNKTNTTNSDNRRQNNKTKRKRGRKKPNFIWRRFLKASPGRQDKNIKSIRALSLPKQPANKTVLACT